MYGLAHDIHNQHYLPWVRTLPQMLKAAGYATALVGKKHILPEERCPFDAELRAREARRSATSRSWPTKHASSSLRMPGKPFLMIVGFSDPHRAAENFGNTQDWPSIKKVTYDPKKIPLPAHLPDVPEVRRGSGRLTTNRSAAWTAASDCSSTGCRRPDAPPTRLSSS